MQQVYPSLLLLLAVEINMRIPSFLLSGNFRNKVLEANMMASIRVSSKVDNVAGVKLPVFEQYDTGVTGNHENLGLVGGGRKITACKEKFGEYLKALIKVASLQTSFLAMDEALKVTNRRVNALENVTIPTIEATMVYIERWLILFLKVILLLFAIRPRICLAFSNDSYSHKYLNCIQFLIFSH